MLSQTNSQTQIQSTNKSKSKNNLTLKQCPCDAPGCPSCILGNILRQNHEAAQLQNLEDSQQEKEFADSANLQSQLFSTAEKYANEANDLENRAKEAAKVLQELAQRAQIARNKYLKISSQAKQVAMKTIQTVLVHQPINSNVKIVPTGIKTTQIVQNVPQYQVTISGDDGMNSPPDSLEEADLRQQLTSSVIG